MGLQACIGLEAHYIKIYIKIRCFIIFRCSDQVLDQLRPFINSSCHTKCTINAKICLDIFIND